MSTNQDYTLIISDTPTALSGVPTHSGAERRTLMSVDAIDMNATYKYSIKRDTNSLVYICCFDFLNEQRNSLLNSKGHHLTAAVIQQESMSKCVCRKG